MALAAGEGVAPTGNDRYGDRARGSPSAGFRSLQKVEFAIAPLGSPKLGSHLQSLSLFGASELQGDTASQTWFLRQCSMSATSTRLEPRPRRPHHNTQPSAGYQWSLSGTQPGA